MYASRILKQRTGIIYKKRGLASFTNTPPPSSPFEVFDRKAKQIQKDRAASRDSGERSRVVDYLRDEVADRMFERFMFKHYLEDIRRKLHNVVDLGAGSGHFSKLLETENAKQVMMLDLSQKSLDRDSNEEFEVGIKRLQIDEEELHKVLPPDSQDAIVSCLSLHWVNDLPGVLVQVKNALKEDGFFLAAMFGGETLFELRQAARFYSLTALQLAEIEREGGISPHVSPMTDTRDISNLLSRAGFTLLTVDIEEIIMTYPSIWELSEDLQDMGEQNAVIGRYTLFTFPSPPQKKGTNNGLTNRRQFLHRDTLVAASAIYKELHGLEDGTVPATFQIIFLIGWKPSPKQQQPLERGSGQKNLKEVLG